MLASQSSRSYPDHKADKQIIYLRGPYIQIEARPAKRNNYVRRHPSRKMSIFYHAGIERKEREVIHKGFQQEKDPQRTDGRLLYPLMDRDVLAGTFKTMGVGLTLTAADKVILMEPSANPGIEKQGLSRAVRIGQKKEVQITYLRCPAILIEDRLRKTNSLRQFFAAGALEEAYVEGAKDYVQQQWNRI
ncbi:hypothetical protein N7G274_007727 [Stereocaulon virgatum]|uniref:Helicase C-terminal domain-containing protein n=1 Tax=Stereocaulon virgatum TaxID=373712 RepID=A0ABR4A0R0_9LECA